MWKIEHTDTFGGQANYAWLNVTTLPDTISRKTLIKKAKEFAGFSGWCRTWTHDYGDMIEIRPTETSGVSQVVFITWEN